MFHPNIDDNGILDIYTLFETWNQHYDLIKLFYSIKCIIE